jgi:hypothetical protein
VIFGDTSGYSLLEDCFWRSYLRRYRTSKNDANRATLLEISVPYLLEVIVVEAVAARKSAQDLTSVDPREMMHELFGMKPSGALM